MKTLSFVSARNFLEEYDRHTSEAIRMDEARETPQASYHRRRAKMALDMVLNSNWDIRDMVACGLSARAALAQATATATKGSAT